MPRACCQGGQRVGLPPRRLEREHEVLPQPLPQRMLRDQPAKPGYQLPVLTPAQTRLQAVLGDRHAMLIQARPGHIKLRAQRDISAHLPAPQRQRPAQLASCQLTITSRQRRPASRSPGLESQQVQLARPSTEQVPRSTGQQPRAGQPAIDGLAQLRRIRLDIRSRRWWRLISPQRIRQPASRDNLVRMKQEGSQHCPWLHAAQRHDHAFRAHLERAENQQVHIRPRAHAPCLRPTAGSTGRALQSGASDTLP